MFGLEGVAVPLGLVLTVLSMVLCTVYGVVNWNRGDGAETEAPCREQVPAEEPIAEYL
jgi:hypothetical protein